MSRLYFTLLLLSTLTTQAQFHNTPTDFVTHLLNKKLYDEAILVMKEKLQHSSNQGSRDSLSLIIGKTYYSLQQLPQSTTYLDKVSPTNAALYREAVFFSAFIKAYSKHYDSSIQTLHRLSNIDAQWIELRNFELAGTFLLQADFERFDSIKATFKNEWPIISQQQANFLSYRKNLEAVKSKSPFLAGTLSAIIPGAGKIYAGRKGNGIYTFLISALLGAQTYEAYRKQGIESARFIIYGSLFTSFYIGNVWGSALAVRVVRNEKRDAITNQVLFDMHIPLRTLFQ